MSKLGKKIRIRIVKAYAALIWLLERFFKQKGILIPDWAPIEEQKKKELMSYARKALRKLGGYEPAFDDYMLESMIDLLFLKKKLEDSMSEKLSLKAAQIYIQVIKGIARVQNELAVSRARRLGKDVGDVKEEVAELMRRIYRRLEELESKYIIVKK